MISRHARSPTAVLGDVLGGEKGPRDAWEIPIWVLVKIRKFSWTGRTMFSQPSVFLYFWNGFVCLGGDGHLFECLVCLQSFVFLLVTLTLDQLYF